MALKRSKSVNAYQISNLRITPTQAIKYHRTEASKSLKGNDYSGYRYHSLQVAKINSGIVINRMRGTKPAYPKQKGQFSLGLVILIAVIVGGFFFLLMALNEFVGGSQVNLFQYIGTPVIWGIGVIAIASIIAFFVNQQFHIFGTN